MSEPPNGPGVYFLIRKGEIVYVGASWTPGFRVMVHRKHVWKEFDDAVYLPVEPHLLGSVEREWIRLIGPVHNGTCNPAQSDRPAWGSDHPGKPRKIRPWRGEPRRTLGISESLFCDLKVICAARRESVNDLIHELLLPLIPDLMNETIETMKGWSAEDEERRNLHFGKRD